MSESSPSGVCVKVVGVGGAGGNAVSRIADGRPEGLELLAFNTDVQALSRVGSVRTFAIGPETTGGMGSGGSAKVGRKALRESQEQVAHLLEGADMVFVTAGMGGGTGTGAAPAVAEMAKKQGALTVAVVTSPFAFEGGLRKEAAERGLQQLRDKVDTLITVDNDRLLSSLDGNLSLEKAFRLADEVLRQGVEGISEIITAPGTINVDFADVRALMSGGGRSFMAMGEGKGKSAATDAIQAALSNPMFEAPIAGASGVLLNVKGGKDLSLGEVQEVTTTIRDASQSEAQVIFGVISNRKWKKRVSITLVATGVVEPESDGLLPDEGEPAVPYFHPVPKPTAKASVNGRRAVAIPGPQKLV